MSRAPMPGSPPEPRLNEQLRLVDWRFLLRQHEVPRTLDLTGGRTSEALRLVTEDTSGPAREMDLVVLGFPSRNGLRVAREALRDGGEVVCLWQRQHPLGVQRARARLARAGFGGARFYWPGPSSAQAPEFWLPIDAPAAVEHVLSQRPVHSRRAAALRLAWRAAARSGMLAPICAVARLSSGPGEPPPAADAIDDLLPAPEPWVLLTGGTESDNKVVGLPFFDGGPAPGLVAKFGRVPKADEALDREAEILRQLEQERGTLPGVPWLRASGRRAGGRTIVQDAMLGSPASAASRRSGYAAVALPVSRWLTSLAGTPPAQPSSSWLQRLVSDPLDELERDFGSLVPSDLPSRARRALGELGDLPLVWEHRDLGPWNVVLDQAGAPAVIDWEDAEPRGLPVLDLVYFLATSALLMDGALDDTSRVDLIRASYGRLLDPSTPAGEVAASCLAEHSAKLGIATADIPRLRLLCWIVQSLIANRRLDSPSVEPGGGYFIHLAEDELRWLEGSN